MRKSYRKIIPTRLKFAAALVDQKDERKPIVPVIGDQKLPLEKGVRRFRRDAKFVARDPVLFGLVISIPGIDFGDCK